MRAWRALCNPNLAARSRSRSPDRGRLPWLLGNSQREPVVREWSATARARPARGSRSRMGVAARVMVVRPSVTVTASRSRAASRVMRWPKSRTRTAARRAGGSSCWSRSRRWAAGLYDGAARCAALTASALGGVLIAVLGAENVLLVDAATFAVAAPLFAFGVRDLPEAQPLRQVEPASLRAYRSELAGGYRFLAATPLLLGLCLMTLSPEASTRDGVPYCSPCTPVRSLMVPSISVC